MSLRRTAPVKVSPAGLSDALDGSNVFPGAMTLLTNLIPDPTTKNVWMCRPAAVELTDFTGFDTPGFVSVQKIIGTRVYGMVASAANVGHDEPFVYDIAAGAFIPITGVSAANTPVSPAQVGDWTPPTMDLVGAYMVVTHPGFAGTGNFFGWFDLTNPAAPVWDAGNTATNALAEVPTAVKQYAERAWFIVPDDVAPATVFTDILDPLTVTNSSQALTYGDNEPLTALGALPLNNQLGGVIQALIVFKQANAYQVTGDAATSNLTLNAMNVAIGTQAPNTVCTTPRGLAFMAVDGIRVIDFKGNVSDPLGFAGAGITVPFMKASTPSRAAAACNANVFRITVEWESTIETLTEEYWYDIGRGCWSGPHTFPSSTIQPYANTFVKTPVSVTGSLWQSDSIQYDHSVFIENGVQLSFAWQPVIFPDTQSMAELNVLESTINIAGSVDTTSYVMQAINSDGATLATATLSIQATVTRWGQFQWGQAVWSVSVTGLTPVPINWPLPVVFRKLTYKLTGFSYSGFKVGDLFVRYEELGYLQMVGT